MKNLEISLENQYQEENQELKPQKQKRILEKKQKQFSYSGFDKLLMCFYFLFIIGTTIHHYIYLNNLIKNKTIYGVSEGYFNQKRDSSDIQWNNYITFFPLILTITVVFMVCKKFIDSTLNKKYVHLFIILFGICVSTYIFGSGSLFFIFFTFINYQLTIFFYKTQYFFIIIHSYNFLCVFVCRYIQLDFNKISIQLDNNLNQIFPDKILIWNVLFNLTILRMVSFSLEMHFSYYNEQSQQPIIQLVNVEQFKETHNFECNDCGKKYRNRNNKNLSYCEKYLQTDLLNVSEFNLINYYSHLLYMPTYLTGPIISFNHYLYQIEKEPFRISVLSWHSIKYALRLLAVFLCMEVLIHLQYCIALTRNPNNLPIYDMITPYHKYLLGLQNFNFLYLKFIFIWQFSRFSSQLCGINCVDDMRSCIYNVDSISNFWRDWHRSFNQWLLRYIYIPLNGNKRQFINTLIVFTYVALWHEFDSNLLTWAYILIFGLFFESNVKAIINKSQIIQNITRYNWYKYVAPLFQFIPCLFLLSSNNYGFGIGFNLSQRSIQQWYQGKDFYQQLLYLFLFNFTYCYCSVFFRTYYYSKTTNKSL